MSRDPGRRSDRATSRRRLLTAALVVALAVPVSACGGAPADGPADFSGTIAIGDGREVFVTCQGAGAPTVVLVSGTGGGADEWMAALPADDPGGAATLSPQSVFDRIAHETRVCAYDRPGTTDLAGRRSGSTSVPQPTTAFDGAADLEALLSSSGEAGPFVLVGASWGGLIAQAFEQTRPADVSGLVLIDSASMFLHDRLTAEQWTAWMAVISASATGDDVERPDYDASRDRWEERDGPPAMPVVVLSSDRAWDLSVTPGQSTWPAWLAAQDDLAASLGARHVGDTGSGHGIHVEQPGVVVAAITSVIDEIRASGAP